MATFGDAFVDLKKCIPRDSWREIDGGVQIRGMRTTFGFSDPWHLRGRPKWSNLMYIIVIVCEQKIPRWFFEKYAGKTPPDNLEPDYCRQDYDEWLKHVI